MNDYFKKVCSNLNLGFLIGDATVINGGITNRMYKVETTKGVYAVKIINKSNIRKNPRLLQNIELSENISNIAKENNINVISAIKFNNQYIQKIGDEKLLIYNWFDGKILLTREITLDNVKTIANMLARLHKIKIKHNINCTKYQKVDYQKYYNLLKDNKEEWAKIFVENYNKLIEVYEKAYSCYCKLSNQKSYVHKDLNRTNIMWKENIPYIIDWETSTIGNPSLDFFNSAWFLTADVNEEKYYTFAKEYLSINNLEDDINIASYAAIIDECNWLEFSLKRAIGIQSKDESEINLGKNSVVPSLTEILNYYNKIPLMIKICKQSK